MIALEATIVSTAMPQIASQLGDMHLYSWAFASFLLTQTATTVVFGKLADAAGVKHAPRAVQIKVNEQCRYDFSF